MTSIHNISGFGNVGALKRELEAELANESNGFDKDSLSLKLNELLMHGLLTMDSGGAFRVKIETA